MTPKPRTGNAAKDEGKPKYEWSCRGCTSKAKQVNRTTMKTPGFCNLKGDMICSGCNGEKVHVHLCRAADLQATLDKKWGQGGNTQGINGSGGQGGRGGVGGRGGGESPNLQGVTTLTQRWPR